MFRLSVLGLFALSVMTHARIAPAAIVLIGDSTVADIQEPAFGWGELLPEFLTTSEIRNRAVSGASSRSFYDESWASVVNELRSDDVLVVQFGHNDPGNPNPAKVTTTPEYQQFLRSFITEAQQVGVESILVTPMEGWAYWNGEHVSQRAGLANAVRAVAAEQATPVIDLNQFSVELFSTTSEEAIRAQFQVSESDFTHSSETGARVFAEQVGLGLTEFLDLEITPNPIPIEPVGPTPIAPALEWDFNNDGHRDESDMDLLVAVVQAQTQDLLFDVSQDRQITSEDTDVFLLVSERSNGDANFDGQVGFADFLILSQNFGEAGSDVLWSEGDFDTNQRVGFSDFLVIARNFSETTEATASASVPEPRSCCWLGFLIAFGLANRIRPRSKSLPIAG